MTKRGYNPRVSESRTCQHCGTNYTANRLLQTFCSRRCTSHSRGAAAFVRDRQTLSDRIERLTERGAANGCWLYAGKLFRSGYGQFTLTTDAGRRTVLAHRVAFEVANGPIPDGMVVMHACDNRQCINPSHLSLGSQADNMADCYKKGRNPRGEKVGNSILTEDQARSIKYGGEPTLAAAERYGVSRRTIWMIRKGMAWAHI